MALYSDHFIIKIKRQNRRREEGTGKREQEKHEFAKVPTEFLRVPRVLTRKNTQWTHSTWIR
jgi:hypothetical protein